MEWQVFVCATLLCQMVSVQTSSSLYDIPSERALFPALLFHDCHCACSLLLGLPAPVSALMQSGGSQCLFQCKYFFC